jgi:hypothetical protein
MKLDIIYINHQQLIRVFLEQVMVIYSVKKLTVFMRSQIHHRVHTAAVGPSPDPL